MDIKQNSFFWTVALIVLILFFTLSGTTVIQTLYFVTFLFPIVFGTAYYFNHYLLPNYLLPAKYGQFALYLVYTIVISLYLEMLIIFLALIIFAQFQVGQTNILTIDLIQLSLALYLMVLVNAFVHIFNAS